MPQDNTDYGQALLQSLGFVPKAQEMAAATMLDQNPLALLSRMIGAGLGTQVGQNPLPNMAQAAKPQLGPYQEGVMKSLKKMGEAQASEALTAGVPPQHIEQQAGLTPQQAQAQAPQGQDINSLLTQPQAQAQQQGAPSIGNQPGVQPNDLLTMLSNLGAGIYTPSKVDEQGLYQGASLFGGLMRTSGEERMQQQTALNLQQKFLGQEPLQTGEREKIGLETQRELLKEAIKMQQEGLLKPEQLLTKYEEASKPWFVQRDAFGRMQAAGQNPSPAGDLAILYGYMKLIDPGSTVREGEFATAQTAGSIPQRVWATYNRVLNGKRLSGGQRKDFLNRSELLFKSAERQQKVTSRGFADLGKRSGIDPAVFMRDVSFAGTAPTQQKGTSGQLPPRSAAPAGAKGWDTEKGQWVF